MPNTNKTAPASSYELLEASFAQYKVERCLDPEYLTRVNARYSILTKSELIIVGMYQRLLEELEK